MTGVQTCALPICISHPDDQEYIWRLLALRGSMIDGVVQESLLRWRHRDGKWHWFCVTEQVLTRNEQGKVQRLIGVARDVTANMEHSHSLRDSERRYRMLAGSLRDVVFTTDSSLRIDYISPSVQTVLGYSPEWAAQHGLERQPGSLAGEAAPRLALAGRHLGVDQVRADQRQQAEAHAAGSGFSFEFDDQCDGGQHGDRHAGHAEGIATTSGRWMRQAFERLNKADGCQQIQQGNKIHAHH